MLPNELLRVSQKRMEKKRRPRSRGWPGQTVLFPFSPLTFPVTLGKSLTLLASWAPFIKQVLADYQMKYSIVHAEFLSSTPSTQHMKEISCNRWGVRWRACGGCPLWPQCLDSRTLNNLILRNLVSGEWIMVDSCFFLFFPFCSFFPNTSFRQWQEFVP